MDNCKDNFTSERIQPTRILSGVTAEYRMAYSAILEGTSFEILRSVLMSISQVMSDLLMPLCEYPKMMVHAIRAQPIPTDDLAARVEMAADRLCEINQHWVRLCHDVSGAASEVDLELLVRGIFSSLMVEQGAHPSPIHLSLETDGRPARLHEPLDALYHLVRDLCLNAVSSMGSGGTLTVRIENVEVHEPDLAHQLGIPTADYLCLQFRDTGPGIAPQCRDTLFDPFVSTATGEGFGLGLSSVYRTMKHIRGFILYRPYAGDGADFILFIPRRGHVES